jgi:CheY-like chemotaxis protein
VQKIRVLVVEDDPVVAKLYSQTIQFMAPEYEVKVYDGDFKRVIETVDWTQVDVVICDQILGFWARGSTILRYVREHFPAIRRIMLTGDVEVGDARKKTADVVFVKPIYPEELVEILRG